MQIKNTEVSMIRNETENPAWRRKLPSGFSEDG